MHRNESLNFGYFLSAMFYEGDPDKELIVITHTMPKQVMP